MQIPISFQGTFRNIKVVQEQKYDIPPEALENAKREGIHISQVMEEYRGHLEWQKDILPILTQNRNVCTGYSSVTTPAVITDDNYTPAYETYILSTEGADPTEVKAVDDAIEAALQRRGITGYIRTEDSNFEEACGSDNQGRFIHGAIKNPIGHHNIDTILYPQSSISSYGSKTAINYPGSPAHIRHYFNQAVENIVDNFTILSPELKEQWRTRLRAALKGSEQK